MWRYICSAPAVDNIDKDLAFMELISYGEEGQMTNDRLSKYVQMSEGSKCSGRGKGRWMGYVGVEGGSNNMIKVSLPEKGALEQRQELRGEVRHWMFREDISRQREEPVLSLGAAAFPIGGQCAWSPVRDKRSEAAQGLGAGDLLFSGEVQRVMLWVSLNKNLLEFFMLLIKFTFM